MDRFFAEEFKEEIENAYRALSFKKEKELQDLEDENTEKREELAQLYVDYQLAIYNNNKELADEIDKMHTEKLEEYAKYESNYLREKASLEGLIKRISYIYPKKIEN